jgi:hypothetical protein
LLSASFRGGYFVDDITAQFFKEPELTLDGFDARGFDSLPFQMVPVREARPMAVLTGDRPCGLDVEQPAIAFMSHFVLNSVPPASHANEVWVNTRSGKYWKPGSRFYGKTKEGEFMSELEALDRGYSPAGGTGQ